MALVLFPAAGNIFLSENFHGLTEGQYGIIFIPQIVFATLSSLSAPKIAKAIGMKKVLLSGLALIATSMLLLLSTQWFLVGELDYYLLLVATAFLGSGFGFSVTTLNPFAYQLFPGKETTALTALHTLMGLGASASPLLLTLFVNFEFWWGAAALVSAVAVGLLLFTATLPLELETSNDSEENASSEGSGIPIQIWLFALATFLYGACEAAFGNFGSVFLEKEGGFTADKAALGLSIMWAGVTAGRVLFAAIALKFSTKWIYIAFPFLLAIVFFVISGIEGESLLISFMILGGLALSFLFPATIGAATSKFPKHASLISGLLVAAFQLGTGFNSNIIGYLSDQTRESPIALGSLYQFSAVYALAMGVIVFFLMNSKKKVA